MVKITFLHPDLGIGGAERLIVDAALALKKFGHDVNIVTTHHDPKRSFAETNDGTLPVAVVGSWIPRHIFGKFYALFAYLRMIYAAIAIYFISSRPDIVVCDLVSICIPILHLFTNYVIFYCHHPDQLLSQPGGCLKSIYRLPLNYLEEITTGQADKIFVNSSYTLKIFKLTFKRLQITPEILYPSIHTEFFDTASSQPLKSILPEKYRSLPTDCLILLSINRYERKKNLFLAIDTLAACNTFLNDTENLYDRLYLIIAGGYDKRVDENVSYHQELIDYASKLNIIDKIIFLKSPTDSEKISLLKNCDVLIYTPENEHFGIVPLEAMYLRKPVVAHNSGGPMETVVDGVTGYLVNGNNIIEDFASKVAKLIRDGEMRKRFGNAGRQRVIESFSFTAFGRQLNQVVNDLTK
ncbi:alpha-1,3/1,6-mannosyltransferase ALG2 [Microplitis mediator]|uniref:alpha-1,3/1,6-mannosyltransferase ALG2 n=1 Tax=Microplitis mediator TaxID=375433 RepID=UPI0025546C24|nr:alpha-1,3/1,6-mannosyltransferase ALG2 [Microplitis mediator]